jgi:hypothetical protein
VSIPGLSASGRKTALLSLIFEILLLFADSEMFAAVCCSALICLLSDCFACAAEFACFADLSVCCAIFASCQLRALKGYINLGMAQRFSRLRSHAVFIPSGAQVTGRHRISSNYANSTVEIIPNFDISLK